MIDFPEDDLDQIFNGPVGDVRTAPVRAPASYKAPDYSEPCKKCRGTGSFTSWSGKVIGKCFACKGEKRVMFKTSPESRQAARQSHAMTKARSAVASFEAFKAEHPAIHAWILAEAPRFEFAAKMLEAIGQYGSLTPGQLAACQRCVDKGMVRATERAERTQAAPQVDTAGIDRLKAAFDSAIAYSAAKGKGVQMRNPKITIGGMTINPAKATSKNPGALYVKQGEHYLGKIAGGKFFSIPACSPAQRDQVLKFVADPAAAAKAYGQETGICCVCNATLKSEWRLRGIGPVCATKYGWA